MSTSASILPPVNLLQPSATLGAVGKGATPDKIKSVAKQFEAGFISSMLQPMFAGINTSGPFGGGEGEGAFRSFLIDAMSKSMVKNGGIGLAPAIEREMRKMQGTNAPTAPAATDAKGVTKDAATTPAATAAAAQAAATPTPTKFDDAKFAALKAAQAINRYTIAAGKGVH
jgi:Rod binding domain-containing protein